MWLVRSVLIFAIIVAVLVFAIGNVGNMTTLRLFTKTYLDVNLNLVLLGAVLFGAATSFFIMIFREFALRSLIRKLRRDTMRLDDELTALRNLPLSGLPEQTTETERR
jgi:uncharacterized integral membrane protein